MDTATMYDIHIYSAGHLGTHQHAIISQSAQWSHCTSAAVKCWHCSSAHRPALGGVRAASQGSRDKAWVIESQMALVRGMNVWQTSATLFHGKCANSNLVLLVVHAHDWCAQNRLELSLSPSVSNDKNSPTA